jgi:catechol 2,3-dioxygenase-like lactoylglutathione lyase family enzyme
MNQPDMPRINGVVETILYVEDLAQASAFYTEVLNLKPMVGDPARFQSFDAGAGRVLLLFKRGGTLQPTQVPGGVIPPHDGHGSQHIAFAIAVRDYEPWRQRLLVRNIAIESETHWERGGRSLYFRDPENHLLELVTPGIWPNY